MKEQIKTTTAVFSRPFVVPGFDEILPAGEYDLETELASPPDHLHPQDWKASVLIKLHPRMSHPGLARTLTVSLADLEEARAKDKLTGRELTDLFLEEMLSDPMVRLVMEADGVSETQLRHLYSDQDRSGATADIPQPNGARMRQRDTASIQVAENEGMPTQAE